MTVSCETSIKEFIPRKMPGVEIVNDTVTGKVSYHVNETGMEDSLVFNTLIVPKGGEYSLELPDGTVVWVNSESSLRFPEKFTSTDESIFGRRGLFRGEKRCEQTFLCYTRRLGKVPGIRDSFQRVCVF